MKPRLLDLFCGAGGCTKGYQRAGFHVVGVDLSPQPRYCGDEFVQADALLVLADLLGERADDVWVADEGDDRVGDFVFGAVVGVGGFDVQVDEDGAGHESSLVAVLGESALPALRVKDFDAIHASPPCQAYNQLARDDHPQLIEPTRALLLATGLPYVIENIPRAPLLAPTIICGSSVGLRVRRHRAFETNWPLLGPPCAHGLQTSNPHRLRAGYEASEDAIVPVYGGGQAGFSIERCREAMGIPWMTTDELNEAIPPAYTELIGAQLLDHLRAEAAA